RFPSLAPPFHARSIARSLARGGITMRRQTVPSERKGGQPTTMPVITGLESFCEQPPDIVRGQRLGLVTTAAAVDRDLRLSVDRILEAGARHGWRLTRLFAPEHGLRGDAPAGAPIEDTTDPITG